MADASYGTSYRQRAMITWYGLGANRLEDAVYPTSEGPEVIKRYSGDSPGKDKEQNWLPAPSDAFVLMMRLYWPSDKAPSILDGTWKPPQVKEAS